MFALKFTEYTKMGLLTGGRSHFKQWKQSQTFTGLKLKGELAKFGLLDATDTTAFCELPSGNYLTGQGGGELVLWDSANVKLIYRKCHTGKIEYLMLDNTGLFF